MLLRSRRYHLVSATACLCLCTSSETKMKSGDLIQPFEKLFTTCNLLMFMIVSIDLTQDGFGDVLVVGIGQTSKSLSVKHVMNFFVMKGELL